MMVFALGYRKPIDSITAYKSLRLWRYEHDDEGWGIIEQLISVLQVNTTRHTGKKTITIYSTAI